MTSFATCAEDARGTCATSSIALPCRSFAVDYMRQPNVGSSVGKIESASGSSSAAKHDQACHDLSQLDDTRDDCAGQVVLLAALFSCWSRFTTVIEGVW